MGQKIENQILEAINKCDEICGGKINAKGAITLRFQPKNRKEDLPLEAGHMAVYSFFYGTQCLKVAQAGPRSRSRYQYQHYETKTKKAIKHPLWRIG